MPGVKQESGAQNKPQNTGMDQMKDQKSNVDQSPQRTGQPQNNRGGFRGRGRYEPSQGGRGRFDAGRGRGGGRPQDGGSNDDKGQGQGGDDKNQGNQRGGFRGGFRGGRGGGGERREKIVHPPPQFTEDGERMFTGRCRLFVGNLPQDMTQDEFEGLFKEFGKYQEAFISAGRGFGFIRMVRNFFVIVMKLIYSDQSCP